MVMISKVIFLQLFNIAVDETNMFVTLLHNQVLQYGVKNTDRVINKSNKETKVNEKQPTQYTRKQDNLTHVPPTPTPDYHQDGLRRTKRDKKLISKSISSLADGNCEGLISMRNLSASTLQIGPDIPIPDYEDSNDHTKSSNLQERNVWSNVDRSVRRQLTERAQKVPTETLKQIMKSRPPVSEVVKEIAKVSEKDKIRQRQRENMQKEAESLFNKQEAIKVESEKNKEKKRPKNSVESSSEDDESQKIYREILEVVKSNSPASLQYGRGRMVGYGEEAQSTLKRGDKKNAVRSNSDRPSQACRCDNREGIIDC